MYDSIYQSRLKNEMDKLEKEKISDTFTLKPINSFEYINVTFSNGKY